MAEMTAKFEVPKEIVDAHIRAALVEALAKHSDYIIRDIVDRALRERGNSYNETIVESAIKQAILAETQAGIKDWIDAVRPKIREQIDSALKAKSGSLLKKLVDNIGAHLAHGFDISVLLKDPPR